MKYCLYTDGAARGNPGPAGAGAYLTDSDGNEVFGIAQFLGSATNNVAEYHALLVGLKEAKKRKLLKLTIYADSELVVRQLKGEYRVKNEGLKPLYSQVMELLDSFEYRVFHIRREQNEMADALANQAIDEKLNEKS